MSRAFLRGHASDGEQSLVGTCSSDSSPTPDRSHCRRGDPKDHSHRIKRSRGDRSEEPSAAPPSLQEPQPLARPRAQGVSLDLHRDSSVSSVCSVANYSPIDLSGNDPFNSIQGYLQ